MGWSAWERALKLQRTRKDLTEKAKVKTGIGKSDLPGLQGGARGNVTWSLMTKCARPGSIPTPDPLSQAEGFRKSIARRTWPFDCFSAATALDRFACAESITTATGVRLPLSFKARAAVS